MNKTVWAPFKSVRYKTFWLCAFLSNIGTWIQDVATSWVLTHLNTSPLVISLLSFASSLPILIFSIFAGYISDLGYRRKILLFSQLLMFGAAALMGFLVWKNSITEWSLLGLSAVIGIGFALTNPAFQSVLTELVPSHFQVESILAYYTGINIARVLGPMVGGGLLSVWGPESAFFINSLSFLGLVFYVWKWPIKEERAREGKANLTKADWQPLFSPAGRQLWLEILGVTFFASSLWALYPTKGRIDLDLSSLQYGLLLASLGLGACVAALFSRVFVSEEHSRGRMKASYLIYSFALILMAMAPSFLYLCFSLVFAGGSWLVFTTLMNMRSREITGSSQLRSTMLGVFLAVFYAGMAVGAVTWGAIAKFHGTSIALFISGGGLLSLTLVKIIRDWNAA